MCETSEGYSEEGYYVGKNDEIMAIVEIEGISKTTKNSKRKQAKIISLFGSSLSVVRKQRDEDITSGIKLNEKYEEKVSSSSVIEMSSPSEMTSPDDNLTKKIVEDSIVDNLSKLMKPIQF